MFVFIFVFVVDCNILVSFVLFIGFSCSSTLAELFVFFFFGFGFVIFCVWFSWFLLLLLFFFSSFLVTPFHSCYHLNKPPARQAKYNKQNGNKLAKIRNVLL